jgi:hypothetical protein
VRQLRADFNGLAASEQTARAVFRHASRSRLRMQARRLHHNLTVTGGEAHRPEELQGWAAFGRHFLIGDRPAGGANHLTVHRPARPDHSPTDVEKSTLDCGARPARGAGRLRRRTREEGGPHAAPGAPAGRANPAAH